MHFTDDDWVMTLVVMPVCMMSVTQQLWYNLFCAKLSGKHVVQAAALCIER